MRPQHSHTTNITIIVAYYNPPLLNVPSPSIMFILKANINRKHSRQACDGNKEKKYMQKYNQCHTATATFPYTFASTMNEKRGKCASRTLFLIFSYYPCCVSVDSLWWRVDSEATTTRYRTVCASVHSSQTATKRNGYTANQQEGKKYVFYVMPVDKPWINLLESFMKIENIIDIVVCRRR